MSKTLGLIHTSATLVPIFDDLVKKYLADKDIKVFNIVDDSLIKNTIQRNKLTPDTARRVVDYVGSAEEAGADYIMVTCSSIGPAVEASELLTSIPVLRVDRPMADKAVAEGKKIGVVATLSTTLEPTSDLVRRRAQAAGKEIELTSKLCEGAFEALMGGKPEEHDRKVAEALKELSEKVDVILLAQASMARVVDQLDEADKKVPILASPPVAMKYLADNL
ncbi:aspartate/glutamate racemase family protein [Gramella jeungdoensis]|uniref:Aspartate/glutamate racemase family protein n=1 Tax=Gramella jeungdoensis TaxID=708091 RepID=A0ABT0YYC7_9FLAO|nr:aspartate/glutamate racemase family protein [Gramella jeungdoensis]MCM8568478.1 aspartate/glutamate racemase family protein [Gramella jeungdoensis]